MLEPFRVLSVTSGVAGGRCAQPLPLRQLTTVFRSSYDDLGQQHLNILRVMEFPAVSLASPFSI